MFEMIKKSTGPLQTKEPVLQQVKAVNAGLLKPRHPGTISVA